MWITNWFGAAGVLVRLKLAPVEMPLAEAVTE